MANRVQLSDTILDVITKMVEGNPGALAVLCGVLNRHPNDGLLYILRLDTLGIYGPRIWMLMKDVCGEDIEEFDDMLINDKTSEAIHRKRIEDAMFAKEWRYYGEKSEATPRPYRFEPC